MVTHLDWSSPEHWNRGRRKPCRICRKPSYLLDDAGRAAHKACIEDAVTNRRHLKVVTAPDQDQKGWQPHDSPCHQGMNQLLPGRHDHDHRKPGRLAGPNSHDEARHEEKP